jgi:hypothetical protein
MVTMKSEGGGDSDDSEDYTGDSGDSEDCTGDSDDSEDYAGDSDGPAGTALRLWRGPCSPRPPFV